MTLTISICIVNLGFYNWSYWFNRVKERLNIHAYSIFSPISIWIDQSISLLSISGRGPSHHAYPLHSVNFQFCQVKGWGMSLNCFCLFLLAHPVLSSSYWVGLEGWFISGVLQIRLLTTLHLNQCLKLGKLVCIGFSSSRCIYLGQMQWLGWMQWLRQTRWLGWMQWLGWTWWLGQTWWLVFLGSNRRHFLEFCHLLEYGFKFSAV